MLKVKQYDYIRTSYRVYGKSIRAIAKETGHSRNTIRKILKGEYKAYKQRNRQPYPVLGPYLKIIDSWLEQDKESPKKQRHTGTRIYNRLKSEHDYSGGETTVRRYVREAKIRLGVNMQKAFIPLNPEIAGEAEVDWGSATAVIGGEATAVKFFCMRSKYSGKHFVRCYLCERQQALFDAHVHAFAFFGGVFPILIYDNLTTAVRKVLQGKNRVLQEAYNRFRGYYNFTPRFCNPGQGHEKGGVEGIVGYARRNYMVPIPQAENLASLNEKILKGCLNYGDHRLAGREKTVNEYFEEENQCLICSPQNEFSNIEIYSGKADKYSTVVVDKNRYSVPTRYAGLNVQIMLYVDRVELFRERKRLASHERLYGNNKWKLEPAHYLELIAQRPQSFKSARPIQQWREHWPNSLEVLLERFCQKQGENKGIKDFISVLMLYKENDPDDVNAAVELGLTSKISSSEGIKHILLHSGPDVSVEPLKEWECLPRPDVSIYGQLGGKI
jgi:transposase